MSRSIKTISECSDILLNTPTYAPRMHVQELTSKFQQRRAACYGQAVRRLTGTNRARAHISDVLSWVVSHVVSPPKSLLMQAIEHMRYITYPELLRGLQTCCTDITSALGSRDYTLLITRPDKSNTWIANLVWDMLPIPHSICRVDSVEVVLDLGIRHLVLCDDAVYSGTQLFLYLSDIHRACRRTGTKGVTIYLCIPFMTTQGRNKIIKANTKGYFTVLTTTHQLIECAQDWLAHDWPQPLSMTDKRLLDKPLTIFEHKVPDAMSFPDILRPCVYDIHTDDNSLNESIENRVAFPHQTPYKHSQEYADTFPSSLGLSRTPKIML